MKYFLVSNTYYFPGTDSMSDVVVKFITRGKDQDTVMERLSRKMPDTDTNIDREISFKDYTLLKEGNYLTEV